MDVKSISWHFYRNNMSIWYISLTNVPILIGMIVQIPVVISATISVAMFMTAMFMAVMAPWSWKLLQWLRGCWLRSLSFIYGNHRCSRRRTACFIASKSVKINNKRKLTLTPHPLAFTFITPPYACVCLSSYTISVIYCKGDVAPWLH